MKIRAGSMGGPAVEGLALKLRFKLENHVLERRAPRFGQGAADYLKAYASAAGPCFN